jgi:LacI family transcriptional regulator
LTGAGRLEGFRKALQEAHLPPREEHIRFGGFSMEGGYRAALEILRLPKPATAVFACNNRMTPGLMLAVKDLGLKCPQDVNVLGFDDFDWSELFSPGPTTIVPPSYEMGKRATEMLLQVVQAPDEHHDSGEEHRVVLKAELPVRESTPPPARGSGRAQPNSIPQILKSLPATEPAA